MTKVNDIMINEIIKLKKMGISIANIASKLDISDRTVLKYSKTFPHPNRKSLILNPKSATGLSIEKAEILGLLCAEGNNDDFIDNYIEYDKRRGKSYMRNNKREWIDFSNMNRTLQEHFIQLMINVYNYPLKFYKKGSSYIQRKEVVRDLRKYTQFGSRMWSVPKELFLEQYEWHARAFLRGYMDGDGSITIKRKLISVDSVNKNTLKEVNKLFNQTGIGTVYYTFETRSRVVIKDLQSYEEFIGFVHPDKKYTLSSINKSITRS